MLEPVDSGKQHFEFSKPSLKPYVMRIKSDRTIPFIELVARKGLISVIQHPDRTYRNIIRLPTMKKPFSETQLKLLQEIDDINKFILKTGINIKSLPLTFRCVTKPLEEIEAVVNDGFTHGGKRPDSHSIGINVDGGSKVEGYLKTAIRNGQSAALFIYNLDKLEPIVGEEKENDPIMKADYGVKPKSGLELKDALLGIITLENSETHFNLKLPERQSY